LEESIELEVPPEGVDPAGGVVGEEPGLNDSPDPEGTAEDDGPGGGFHEPPARKLGEDDGPGDDEVELLEVCAAFEVADDAGE